MSASDHPAAIRLRQLSIRLGLGSAAFEAVQNVSLDIEPGQFVCLLGPSGCGKSTLLGALAGHLTPASGQALLDGERVAGPHPERGLVFQHHTLFPWKTVAQNVAFGLKMKGVDAATRQRQAEEFIDLVGLTGFARHYPGQLSGGMQQRVEIARVLINHPRVLLMDEPFGALDALTRLKMQELLLEIRERIRTTVLFVTHDIDEALLLADRVLIMSPRPGRIIEDLPVDLPRPRFAAAGSARFASLKQHCLALLRYDEPATSLPRLTPLGAPPAHQLQFAI
ncbi:NitT/TauT family transport system ATP-binding protein [Silvimonas terrae]|uniref:NitT/TauT family transport system ATP-binding protein n=1 Tax=Silvimonas terrae TaxID=300266 RepID=A0A840RD30_9NEIS|nr:ABC transporter ATP-binding protein [Silvimonas terrae]MBB5190877.1 NitT/TauT family transport system ATP-binding protein [Silvimonas terrae]